MLPSPVFTISLFEEGRCLQGSSKLSDLGAFTQAMVVVSIILLVVCLLCLCVCVGEEERWFFLRSTCLCGGKDLFGDST